MIKVFEIQKIVQDAIDEAFERAIVVSKENFIAFIAEGDYNETFKRSGKTPFVIESKNDIRYDVKRHEFMCRYLNNHYSDSVSDYSGENGVDELIVEMMIYTHVWESYYFIKHLIRLAQLSLGKPYLWKVEIPDNGKRKLIYDNVINPTKKENLLIGSLVEDSYSSYLRNSFAHSRYIIYEKTKDIYYGCNICNKIVKRRLPFDEFQRKFFQSAFLSYYLLQQIGVYKKELMGHVGYVSAPIRVQDEVSTERKIIITVERSLSNNNAPILKTRIE